MPVYIYGFLTAYLDIREKKGQTTEKEELTVHSKANLLE